ncbi:MAG: T9SS type A sorting domain-containing protein [Candidatus Eisenbacteria bacterium]
MLAALSSFASGAEAQGPGIVTGPGMRLAGNHTFVFNPSGGGGTVTWSVDRVTISDSGVHTRTDGIASGTGPVATFALTASSGLETLYYVSAADAGSQDVETVQVVPADIKTWFTYRSAGNPDVRVYAVVPSSLSATTRVLMAMHGNSRTASEYADIWRTWATQHDYIVLCPYYDLANWPTTGMYQMGNVFSGNDCDGTLNPEERWTFTIDLGIHQRVRDGFALADPRFDMWGFSGGGQHVHRFMIFKPDAPVRLAIAAGSGLYTAVDGGIDCPYGLVDAGLAFTQQDLVDWTNRNITFMVGTADTLRDEDLRTTARADAQGRNRYERAGYMWNKGSALNPLTRWRRIDVPGVGHSAKPMAQAAQSFLQEASVDVPAIPAPVARRAVLRVSPNPFAGSASLWGEGWGSGEVKLEVYDLAGRKVAVGTAPVLDGKWRLAWSALVGSRNIAKGIYLVRTRDRERQAEQKVVIIE